jgi:hypothetical protein
MSQLIPIVSEALQATVRKLLPSQAGFGEDLQASNVIVPIIDLTPSAEGSQLATDLQRSFSFQSITSFSAQNSTAVIANSPGFYRIFAAVDNLTGSGTDTTVEFQLSNGLSTKSLWKCIAKNVVNDAYSTHTLDFIVFLAAGESVSCISNATEARCNGSSRQIADVSGLVSNPAGYVSQ